MSVLAVELQGNCEKPVASPVFDSYWHIAAERQRIFRSRLRSEPQPTTADPILQEYRFTNAYRASDRVSQYLIRNVIHDAEWAWEDSFVRVLLFKLFNRIETWETLRSETGEVSRRAFDPTRYAQVLDEIRCSGVPIYSAAYIMPSATAFGSRRKHVNHLRLVAMMLEDGLPEEIAAASSLRNVFESLLRYPSVGPFLAYQLSIDLNYTPHLRFGEDEFVVPGPGALDGLSKAFLSLGSFSLTDAIQWVSDTQQEQFTRRGIDFEDLWDRPLQLIDCQNLFCEVDKYARVAHPEFKGRTGRTRIKQRFRPSGAPVTAWYPPKWGINGTVERWLDASLA
jgi:hypothetical protein